MKYLLLICVFLLLNTFCNASSNDSIIFSREGVFDFAIIEHEVFYTSIRPKRKGYTNIVRKTHLKKRTPPVRHSVAGSYDPTKSFNWFLINDIMYSYHVIPNYHIGKIFGLNVHIVYREFESRDSLVVSQEPPQRIIENKVSVTPVAAYFAAIRDKYKGHHEQIDDAINKFYNYINFDIYFDSSDSLINFYMRDKDAFYIWEAPLPDNNSMFTEWNLKKAYAAPYYDHEFIPRTANELYDSSKTLYNAIKDTLFFDGHFKMIKQNGEKYIINREHACIYHISGKRITRIGTVLVTESYPKIQGKPLFIEDRDHNRLIFFAPVEWEDTNLPKPNVYYMKEDEMREYFKYVMN